LSRKRDRRGSNLYKSPLEIRKRLYKEEWKELEDNKRLLNQQLMKIRTPMNLKCKKISWSRDYGVHS